MREEDVRAKVRYEQNESEVEAHSQKYRQGNVRAGDANDGFQDRGWWGPGQLAVRAGAAGDKAMLAGTAPAVCVDDLRYNLRLKLTRQFACLDRAIGTDQRGQVRH